VAQKLALQWSPQQISGWLKQEFPTHQDMQISHEAIYRILPLARRQPGQHHLPAASDP
jgi:IS30 family transposase